MKKWTSLIRYFRICKMLCKCKNTEKEITDGALYSRIAIINFHNNHIGAEGYNPNNNIEIFGKP